MCFSSTIQIWQYIFFPIFDKKCKSWTSSIQFAYLLKSQSENKKLSWSVWMHIKLMLSYAVNVLRNVPSEISSLFISADLEYQPWLFVIKSQFISYLPFENIKYTFFIKIQDENWIFTTTYNPILKSWHQTLRTKKFLEQKKNHL